MYFYCILDLELKPFNNALYILKPSFSNLLRSGQSFQNCTIKGYPFIS